MSKELVNKVEDAVRVLITAATPTEHLERTGHTLYGEYLGEDAGQSEDNIVVNVVSSDIEGQSLAIRQFHFNTEGEEAIAPDLVILTPEHAPTLITALQKAYDQSVLNRASGTLKDS